MRLLYLKYILEQNEESLLSKFFKLQLEQPTRGDWASTCIQNLKELSINLSLLEIKLMTKQNFKKILKSRTNETALKYLLEKQKSKGKEMKYASIQMNEYLLPTNSTMTIEQKQKMFAVKNRMIDIPANFSNGNNKTILCCGEIENLKHLYKCKILNNGIEQMKPYENLYTGNIKQQIEIFRIVEQNLKKREDIQLKNCENQPPCDPCDPLYSVMD